MTDQRYDRLVAAVRAYAEALREYGAAGVHWTESGELDRLWDAVLSAAGLDHDTTGDH